MPASGKVITDLHDRFKVKAHAIPQRELPTARPRKEPSSLGCPTNDVDWVLNLVQRCMKVLRRNGFRWFIWMSSRGEHLNRVSTVGTVVTEYPHR